MPFSLWRLYVKAIHTHQIHETGYMTRFITTQHSRYTLLAFIQTETQRNNGVSKRQNDREETTRNNNSNLNSLSLQQKTWACPQRTSAYKQKPW